MLCVLDSSMLHTSSIAADSCPLSPESTCIGSTAAASAEDCPSVSMATILSGEPTKSAVESITQSRVTIVVHFVNFHGNHARHGTRKLNMLA